MRQIEFRTAQPLQCLHMAKCVEISSSWSSTHRTLPIVFRTEPLLDTRRFLGVAAYVNSMSVCVGGTVRASSERELAHPHTHTLLVAPFNALFTEEGEILIYAWVTTVDSRLFGVNPVEAVHMPLLVDEYYKHPAHVLVNTQRTHTAYAIDVLQPF